MKNRKATPNFINADILIEHEDKDGFLAKGTKLELENVFINPNTICMITSPSKSDYYIYDLKAGGNYKLKSMSVFKIKVLDHSDILFLLEKEFDKFKDILYNE